MGVGRRAGGRKKIERQLHRNRPKPPDALVARISRRVSPGRGRTLRVPRPAFAFVLSGALLVAAVAAVGGPSGARSLATEIVDRASFHDVFFGGRMALEVQTENAANDEYGGEGGGGGGGESGGGGGGESGGGGGGGGGGTTTTTSTTTETAGGSTSAEGETTQQAEPGTSGGVTLTAPGTSQTTTVQWAPETFPVPVVVVVDPTPEEITNTALVGSGNQLVSVVAIDPATGEQVRELAAPLDIVFTNPVPGFVPVISNDGVNFRAVPRVPGPGLPANLRDGYYVDADGAVHILTRHLTVFAVLYRANVKQSESGRPTKEPGSGLFGDPTRIHVGPPVLRQIGPVFRVALGGGRGNELRFSFEVDEQASVIISIFRGDEKLLLAMEGTRVRGHLLRGVPRRNLKVVILRPGTVNMRLRVPGRQLAPGRYRIRVWAVDYDGKRTIRFIPFRVT